MVTVRVGLFAVTFAVCLDGSAPGYHLQRGSGTGSQSWLIHLEVGDVFNRVQFWYRLVHLWPIGLIVSFVYNACVVNLNSWYRNECRSENCLSLKLCHNDRHYSFSKKNDRHYLLVCVVKMNKKRL